MPLHLLTNFEIQRYYQKKPRFNGIYPSANSRVHLQDKGI